VDHWSGGSSGLVEALGSRLAAAESKRKKQVFICGVCSWDKREEMVVRPCISGIRERESALPPEREGGGKRGEVWASLRRSTGGKNRHKKEIREKVVPFQRDRRKKKRGKRNHPWGGNRCVDAVKGKEAFGR